MRISSNLTTSRYNVYYYRFSIPVSLHPERKQTSLRVSLNTRCSREALQLSHMLGYVAERILRQPGIRGMNYEQIRNVLHEHFKEALVRHSQHIATHGPRSEWDVSTTRSTIGLVEQAMNDKDYTFVGSDRDMNRFIELYTLPIVPGSKDYDLFRSEFFKAFRDYLKASLKVDTEQDGYDFSAASDTPTTKLKARKLAETIEEYCEEKLRLKKWRPNSAKEYRSQFNLLLRILGQDASLHVSSDTASDVKMRLLRLPKNMNKKADYKDKSIEELAALKLPDAERLSAVSVAKHMRTYSTFFDWAVEKKRTSENNFSPFVDDVKKAHVAREAFNATDTQRIMQAVLNAKKPHQKWGVLIAFYTGARLNEIAQLDTSDIKKADGIWCFHFTDEGENKSLKNEASKRVVPIHSRLIELGFLDYHKAVGKGRLFTALTYHPRDGYGRNLGRWFNGSLLRNQLKITSPTLVFHSIRHTVAQQLRNNKVPEATLKDILGHSHAGVTMNIYAKHLDKTVMQEAIETLRYA